MVRLHGEYPLVREFMCVTGMYRFMKKMGIRFDYPGDREVSRFVEKNVMTAVEYKLMRAMKCFMLRCGFPEIGIVEAKAFLRKYGK